jgi:hypothetical protein
MHRSLVQATNSFGQGTRVVNGSCSDPKLPFHRMGPGSLVSSGVASRCSHEFHFVRKSPDGVEKGLEVGYTPPKSWGPVPAFPNLVIR